MRLIVDSGSTKAEWCLVESNEILRIKTQGLSPFFLTSEEIELILKEELLPALPHPELVEHIYFYGTGCSSEKNNDTVRKALNALFAQAVIYVDHDLMAAAHSLCGSSSGIVCILGTGSSSCQFNGVSIARNNPGLGYILGDEGSGAYLGKKLLQSYLYGRMDSALVRLFETRFNLQEEDVLATLYSHPLANRYLASFSVFLAENRSHPVIEAILYSGLEDFFKEHISTYTESSNLPVHFTGSIAWIYRDVLNRLCQQYQFTAGTIEKEPMNGLVNYYQHVCTISR